MLRRKTPRRSASAATALRFAKGPTRASAKRQKQQRQSTVVADVRGQVFTRDKACRACNGLRKRYRFGFIDDEMHEIVPRSKTRGMEPEQRFNTQNCIRLCHWCHNDVTEKRLHIVALSVMGADGEVVFEGGVS